MYVVLFRPLWFWKLTENLYQQPIPQNTQVPSQQTRKKCFLSLLGLFIIDIAPAPVTPVVAFIIILSRPIWFYQLVANIYEKSDHQ
jgi:hypothetical protein